MAFFNSPPPPPANTPRPRSGGRGGAESPGANVPRSQNQPRPVASAGPDGELTVNSRAARRAAELPAEAPKPKKVKEPKPPRQWQFKTWLAWFNDRRVQLFVGFTLLFGSLYLASSFVSYLFTGHADQSVVENLDAQTVRDAGAESKNGLGLLGAWIAHQFLYYWFGVASFALLPFVFFLGYRIVFRRAPVSLLWMLGLCLFVTAWASIAFGYAVASRAPTAPPLPEWLAGGAGFEVASWLRAVLGAGTALLLALLALAFVIFFFNVTTLNWAAPSFAEARQRRRDAAEAAAAAQAAGSGSRWGGYEEASPEDSTEGFAESVGQSPTGAFAAAAMAGADDEPEEFTGNPFEPAAADLKLTRRPGGKPAAPALTMEVTAADDDLPAIPGGPGATTLGTITAGLTSASGLMGATTALPLTGQPAAAPAGKPAPAGPTLTVVDAPEPERVVPVAAPVSSAVATLGPTVTPDSLLEDLITDAEDGGMTNYDPTLDLPRYLYPTLELLNDYGGSGRVQVSKEELEANKDRIVETLGHYNIGIASIKATIGPTVTLYEIVPEVGIRISKIKSLEDDIALSLAALGIRIIAPIPGKGTIGIEVPNARKEMVSMRSMLQTERFQNAEMDLPIAFGRTITNEPFVVDLARMPHLLMAGATGQGKSVGLNVILTSLLYKRHPAQLKFVLVDPKKVELSLFNKIERHFLATLPDAEEAIITDTSKVVDTLNSLCILMDQRYTLLKDAGVRNLKEYNKKFIERKLLPTKGHKFMPFIVVVIDELADLMMTAGKEVEQPIARLAQLARAIGIHLVVATQRPSVNVITGIIKANFPARISFKVSAKVDSRTILDASGADQLIGQGDMLFSAGSDLIRVQCAFVDTPEVDRICDFIGEQQGYATAYELPEYVGATSGNGADGGSDLDSGERDAMFEEAARVIVTHQQGSTSLLQRRLKLGYNRAGRLIDQLEKAGIVGPFEGSKSRDVLIPDEHSLEQLLSRLESAGK